MLCMMSAHGFAVMCAQDPQVHCGFTGGNKSSKCALFQMSYFV